MRKRTRHINEWVIGIVCSGFQNTNCYIWIFAQSSIVGDDSDATKKFNCRMDIDSKFG